MQSHWRPEAAGYVEVQMLEEAQVRLELEQRMKNAADSERKMTEYRRRVQQHTSTSSVLHQIQRARMLSKRDDHKWLQLLHDSVGYQVFQTMLSVASCVLYVIETYMTTPYDTWVVVLELVFAGLFVLDFVINVLSSDDRYAFLISPMAVVDFLSITPVVLVFEEGSVGFFQFFRILKAVRILRLHRLLQLHEARQARKRQKGGAQTERVPRQMIALIVTIGSLVFMASGVVHMFESNDPSSFMEPVQFHDAVYFTIVTFTTVGFGDIYPRSAASRLVMVCFISLAFILVPYQVNQLVTVAKGRSAYTGEFKVGGIGEQHIVVCGSVTSSALETVFSELFHSDHGQRARRLRVVVLNPDEPDEQLASLLSSSTMFRTHVRYLRGSPLDDADLERAKVRQAWACMVLTNHNSADVAHEDMFALLRALAVHNFSPRIDLFVQLTAPAAAAHAKQLGLKNVVCREEIKLQLLAASCLCPGFSALVCNLIRSHSALPPELLTSSSWYSEYYMGVTREMYIVEFSPALAHLTFQHAAALLFEMFELVLFGVEVAEPRKERHKHRHKHRHRHAHQHHGEILINPGDGYEIQIGDKALVIAESPQDAKSVWDYMGDEDVDDPDLKTSLERCRQSLVGPHAFAFDAVADSLERSLEASLFEQTCPHDVVRERGQSAAAPAPAPAPAPADEDEGEDAAAAAAGVDRARLLVDGLRPDDVSAAKARALLRDLQSALRPAAAAIGSSHGRSDPVLESAKHLADHIIVMGASLSRVDGHFFIAPLRAEHLHTFRTVVVLSEDEATFRAMLRELEDSDINTSAIYLVVGSPLERGDLDRAGVATANTVVFMSHQAHLQKGEDVLVDSEALVTWQHLEALLPKGTHPIVELVFESNMRFLHRNAHRYTDGHGYTFSDEDSYLWPLFAAGRVYSNAMLDSLISHAYYRPGALTVLHQLLFNDQGEHEEEARRQSHLFQLSIPDALVNHSYGELYQHLVKNNMIALGLYRAKGTRGAPEAYVVTAPTAATVIHRGDLVFVLYHAKATGFGATPGEGGPPPPMPRLQRRGSTDYITGSRRSSFEMMGIQASAAAAAAAAHSAHSSGRRRSGSGPAGDEPPAAHPPRRRSVSEAESPGVLPPPPATVRQRTTDI